MRPLFQHIGAVDRKSGVVSGRREAAVIGGDGTSQERKRRINYVCPFGGQCYLSSESNTSCANCDRFYNSLAEAFSGVLNIGRT